MKTTMPVRSFALNKLCHLFIVVIVLCLTQSPSFANTHGINIKDKRILLDPPKIYKKNGVIFYDGQIVPGAALLVIKLLNNNKISKISMNSIGGDVSEALDIADIIFEKNLDVEVRSVCASACANYIFPAGKNKFVNDDSFILWHGGVNGPIGAFVVEDDSDPITLEKFSQLPYFISLKKRELLFYKKIGVYYKIGFCPQLLENYNKKFPEKWFSYSESDLNKLGVNNIYYSGTSSEWFKRMKKNGVIFADHCK